LNKSLAIILLILVTMGCNRHRPIINSQSNAISTTDKKLGNSTTEEIVLKKEKQLEAKIIRILDGDTVEMLYDQLPIKLRLEHIDAPEKRGKQPFGNRAKQTLSDLCFEQVVTIHSDGKFDRNGRLIGVIFNKEGLNVNKEMVRLGMAWHFKKYSDDMSYDELEKEARKGKVGLWIDPNPIAPWDFR
jgi:micrococcal nuclease